MIVCSISSETTICFEKTDESIFIVHKIGIQINNNFEQNINEVNAMTRGFCVFERKDKRK